MADDDKKRERAALVVSYMTLPFVLAVPPIIGWAIGFWLDKQLNTKPWFMYGLLVVGLIAGVREFYRIVKKYGNGGSGQ